MDALTLMSGPGGMMKQFEQLDSDRSSGGKKKRRKSVQSSRSVSRAVCLTARDTARCIRPYLDTKTASTIATSTVHSRLDYCNSLYHNLPKSQITRLQQIQNSLARAVVKAPKNYTGSTPWPLAFEL